MNASSIRTPSGNQISLLFKQLVKGWHLNEPALEWDIAQDRFPQNLTSFEGKTAQLGLINCFQWHLEDECRSNYDSFEVLAHLKHAIDQSNHRRVTMIDEIDNEVSASLLELRQESPVARLALISPGNIIDRLSILELKLFHVITRAARNGQMGENHVAEMLEEQIQDVCMGFDELMDDLSTGRLRLKFYWGVKLYGSNKSGQQTSKKLPS
jgi:Protein of unknown function (DUF4254)